MHSFSACPVLTSLPRSLRPKANYFFNVEIILERTGDAAITSRLAAAEALPIRQLCVPKTLLVMTARREPVAM